MKKFGLLIMPLMTISFLSSCGGFKPEPTKKWYEYENWWNYCSNDNPISEATSEDIGKEVNVTVYGIVHKVRLIDVDHIEPKEKVAQAHCTFEFINVITDSNGAVTTNWNVKEPEVNTPNNYNFPESTLNDLLNNNTDCIFNKLPKGLQGAIKEVNKKVGIGSSYSTDKSYSTKLFPLAHDEMVDHGSSVAYDEGTKYQYYIDHTKRKDLIKRKAGIESGDGEYYWFRSPDTDFSFCAYYVDDDGFYYSDYYGIICNFAYAVAPAFCI